MEINKSQELLLANLVLPLVKDLILPKINNLLKKRILNKNNSENIQENAQEYLIQKYIKHTVIDTIAFANKQTLFDVLYQPLTLYSEILKEKIETKITSFPKELFSKHYRIIVEDTAGMGKSTLLVKIFRSAIEEKIGIPILIPLRQINKKNSIINEIYKQFSLFDKSVKRSTLLKLIQEGEFIFLFDGFDEISLSDKQVVLKNLHHFIEIAKDNFFLISSRPEESLTSFGDFQKFNVKPLLEIEAFSLLRNYDYYSHKPISEELIKQISNNRDLSLKDYLSNPFLVSLLFKSFDYKKDIPLKKSTFYGQVYDALFETHDLSKEGYLKREKYSKLHSDDFNRVLRHISYFTSIENKVEYDKNYLINIIDKVIKYVPDLNFHPSDVLKDLLETVPLFRKDGNYIKWAHKSLQDYFTAKFIWNDAKAKQIKILNKIYDEDSNSMFANILDLFYELDPVSFEDTILYRLLCDYKKYYKSFEHLTNIPIDQIKKRVSLTFGYSYQLKIWKSAKEEQFKFTILNGKILFNDEELGHLDSLFTLKSEDNSLSAIFMGKAVHNISSILFILERRHNKFEMHTTFPSPNSFIYNDKLTINNLYDLNSDRDNILNSLELFEYINDMIIMDHRLNYDIAMKKLEAIETRKKKEDDELVTW